MKREFKHPITKLFLPVVLDFCRYPDLMKIEEAVMDKGPSYQVLEIRIFPHMADYRVICGKHGRQINAIKFLIKRAGILSDVESTLHLEESFIGDRETPGKFRQNPEFDIEAFRRMLLEICRAVFEQRFDVELQRSNDKLYVFISSDPSEIPTVAAINDMLYPWGFRNGMTLDIKPPRGQPTTG